MHAHHQLWRTQRPSLSQHQIVDVLQTEAGHLAEDVHGIQHFLQVDHADLEWPPLLFHYLAQRVGRRPVPAAGVEIDEIHPHSCTIVACGNHRQPKTLSFTDVFSRLSPKCSRHARLQLAYEVRSARPHQALGNVHDSGSAQSVPGKLQPTAGSLREAQTPRHGPGDRHRSRFHRRRRASALPPRFLPQRRSHLHACPAAPNSTWASTTSPSATTSKSSAGVTISNRCSHGWTDHNLLFSANHVFSSLTGRRTFERFRALRVAPSPRSKPATATCWPAPTPMPPGWPISRPRPKSAAATPMPWRRVGCAWTVVPGARNRQEYLRGLRRGLGRVRGDTGSYRKLTRDVFTIGRANGPRKARTLCPWRLLAWLVPLIILHNYASGKPFSHAGGWHATCSLVRCGARSTRIAEVAA